jgi:hypothetical protein
MFTKSRVVSATLIACAAAGATAWVPLASSAATTTQTSSTPSAAQTETLSSAEKALLVSAAPKQVVMNPLTGDITSVTAVTESASPYISNHNICSSGNGCYETNKPPYADQGFYGSAGTYKGKWPYRNGYTSGQYTVSACWEGGVKCGPKIGPKSKVAFSVDVTGVSFTIY